MRNAKRSRALPIIILSTFALLLFSGPAAAHLPYYGEGGPTMETAYKIPDANVSYAIFAEYSGQIDRIHFYAFSVEAEHLLNFQILVPAVDEFENFAPVALMIGPGLQTPDSYTNGLLSEFNVVLAPGDGALSYVYNGTENVVEFEAFTQTEMWERQDVEITLPQEATYYVAVAVPESSTQDATNGFGKYVFAPGILEDFGFLDFVSLPIDWVTTQAFWGNSVLVMMIPTFLILVLGTATTWYYVRGHKPESFSTKGRALEISFFLAVAGALLMVGTSLNQILLVFYYEGLDLAPVDLVVIMLQSIGVAIGAIALYQSFRLRFPAHWMFLIAIVIEVLVALMIGAGFIVGPTLFLIAASVELFLARAPAKSGRTEP